jgi:hypothetical protein
MLKFGIDLGMPALMSQISMKSLPPVTCTDGDILKVLDTFDLPSLKRLEAAFGRGLVIRRIFHAGDGRGCLLYHLDHSIISFGAQSGFFAADAEVFRASQQLVAAWDSDSLSESRVRELVATAISTREAVRKSRKPWKARMGEIAGPEPRHWPDASANSEATTEKCRTRMVSFGKIPAITSC